MNKRLTTFLYAISVSIVLMFSAQNIHAQDVGNVRGVVADSTNGEALAFCSVYIPELKRGMTTDSRGIFLFTGVTANKRFTIITSYVGYSTKRQYFTVASGKMTQLKIMLSSSNINIKEVEVEGERVKRENATDISLQKITARELEALPKNVESDVLRSLQYVPGVQFTGDASARYYVRGGTNNQNLVLLDDAPIYNPYHALGIFSSIDPEMINSMEFHKGAYPTEFSGRLSSVLKINTKDGNKNKFSASASISFISAKALIEGPFPGGSFIITGRKSTSSEILKKFLNDKSYPIDFYDWSFKINYADPKVIKDAKFTLHGFFSGDNLLNNNPLKQDFKWSNNVLGFNYFQLSDSPLFYDISVNYSKFYGEVFPNSTPTKASFNDLHDVSAKVDIKYIYDSKDELNVGLKIQEIGTTLKLTNSSGFVSDLGSRGTEISVYAKYMFLQLGAFGADIGTRLNLTRMAGGGFAGLLEPRARFTLRILPEIALKGAWGVYQQELTTISDENEIIALYEPWIITPRYLNPSKSIHYTAGLETEFVKDFIMNFDGYYKKATDIAIVNDDKIFADDKDLVPGSSEAYGLEILLKNTRKNLNINVSYTLSWAFITVNGVRYVPRYDSKHNLSIALDYDFGAGWKASVSWVYNSGHPFTQIRGYYDKLNTDALFAGNLILQQYLPYILLADRNLARLPDYHRLDITLSKQFDLSFMKLYLDVSVINAYDRKNIFYFDRKTGERVNMLPLLPTATIKAEI
jgi:hypothetical protein